jgi:hypothetical protein
LAHGRNNSSEVGVQGTWAVGASDSVDQAVAAEQARRALVEELRATGIITSAAVEAALLAVPRHAFVPDGTRAIVKT